MLISYPSWIDSWIYRCECQGEGKSLWVCSGTVFLKLSIYNPCMHLFCIHSSALQTLLPFLNTFWNFSLKFQQYLPNNFLNVLHLILILFSFLLNYMLTWFSSSFSLSLDLIENIHLPFLLRFTITFFRSCFSAKVLSADQGILFSLSSCSHDHSL